MSADEGMSGRSPAPRSATRGQRLSDLEGPDRLAFLGAGAVVMIPFLVAVVAAKRDGWTAVGDDAVLAVNAHDVGTALTPLLGMTTTANRYVPDVFAHHPGPLVFDYYAPFVRVFGDALGLLLAVGLLVAASTWAIGYVTFRVAGPARAIGAWIVTLAMLGTIGGASYLYQPINAVVVVAPALLFLYLCWALVSHRGTLAPLWVLAGSWVLQAELQWALLIAAEAAATVALVTFDRLRPAVAARRSARSAVDAVASGPAPDGAGDEPEAPSRGADAGWRPVLRALRPADRSERRTLWLTVGVAVVVWAAPLFEAVTQQGGNVWQLYRAATESEVSSIGLRAALDLLGPTLRGDPGTTVSEATAEQGLGALGVLLVLIAAVLVAAGWRRLTSSDRRLVVLALIGLTGALVSLSAVPNDEGFLFYRSLPGAVASAFAWFAVASAVASAHVVGRSPADRIDRRAALVGGVAVTVVVAVMVALPLPVVRDEYGRYTFAAAPRLADQVAERLEGDGTWQVRGVGPRTVLYIRDGLAEGLERRGDATNLRRSPSVSGKRVFEPFAGNVLVMTDFVAMPEEWTRVGEYTPPGWDPDEAAAVAAEAVSFAAATDTTLTPAGLGALPTLLCPPTYFDGSPCPEAEAATGSVDDLPPWLVPLLYVEQYEERFPSNVTDGPRPPDALLERLRDQWAAPPVVVVATTDTAP